MDTKITIPVSADVLKNLDTVVRILRKRTPLPDDYGEIISRYAQTTEFRLLQKESELKAERNFSFLKDLEIKCINRELQRKDAEIESLKKQVEALRNRTAA